MTDLDVDEGSVPVRGSRDREPDIAEIIRRHFGSPAGSLFGDSVFQTRVVSTR
ncbi:MAG: hypothetical protein M5T61_09895 [Acidimicrobiia bacterium]|nr:hypothetical protein [Acidimicrobiia bacterium]